MASGFLVKREGVRGVVWSMQFRDSDGRQVKRRIGSEAEGTTKKKAAAALRAQLVDVDKGYRKPARQDFGSFAETWVATYPAKKGLKRSTTRSYELIVNELVKELGRLQLHEITLAKIESYMAACRREGLSGATANRRLNVLSLILRAALRQGLITSNPVALVDRPREPRRKWRILTPVEVGLVERALDELVAEAECDRDSDDRRTVLALFLTLMATGIRRSEALGLHWRSVLLADPDGPVMRIESTWVRCGDDTPKSAAGHRTIALGERLAGVLLDHRASSAFSGDDERVFANPRSGRPFDVARYKEILGLALGRAGVDGLARPFHDLRCGSITNSAAAGTSPEALMARAGHASFSTTRRYIDSSGERFREEAARLEQRLGWGAKLHADG